MVLSCYNAYNKYVYLNNVCINIHLKYYWAIISLGVYPKPTRQWLEYHSDKKFTSFLFICVISSILSLSLIIFYKRNDTYEGGMGKRRDNYSLLHSQTFAFIRMCECCDFYKLVHSCLNVYIYNSKQVRTGSNECFLTSLTQVALIPFTFSSLHNSLLRFSAVHAEGRDEPSLHFFRNFKLTWTNNNQWSRESEFFTEQHISTAIPPIHWFAFQFHYNIYYDNAGRMAARA